MITRLRHMAEPYERSFVCIVSSPPDIHVALGSETRKYLILQVF